MFQLASVGLEMGIAVAIGAGLGYLADSKLGTNPWLLLVGVLVGTAAGFRGMIRAARKAKRTLESSNPREGKNGT